MTKSHSIRVDDETYKSSLKVFDDLGMDFSTGIRIYLKKVVKTNGIPFDVTNENGLDRSLAELNKGDYRSFNSVDDLFNDLNEDD
ncbi:type II toxin-antitoxin system RelB/DinJ family antitoxin [uncultured Limosilactobacillus sp.]|uniref:type II toxin-antitoxin system RelB/DinJ family antitoxin n=1 Tax=uncultured Limosilactobacillus sp. TaxID=2837629 RepID=UPI0025F5E942|nr:type II toxin-antitoxin system RelB/DinJ family antitoxin [uncultured Limosilactobacillus sp.]